jgi:hypothetical protein
MAPPGNRALWRWRRPAIAPSGAGAVRRSRHPMFTLVGIGQEWLPISASSGKISLYADRDRAGCSSLVVGARVTGAESMSIALDCPGCGKHYEVDLALAGKKSRCKQCGEVFLIPVPAARAAGTTAVSQSSGPGSARRGAAQWESAGAEKSRTPPEARSAATVPSQQSPSRSSNATIVINCPTCRKRYELDAMLAGKKSRCKNCGEVFSIPVPMGRPVAAATAGKPAAPAPEAPAYWESVLEAEPASLKASRAPAPQFDEEDLPPPARAVYRPPRKRRGHSGGSGSAVNVGPIIGWFLGLAAVSLIGIIIWSAVNQLPYAERYRLGSIFGQIFFLGCLGLSLWGYAWIVTLAFRDDAMQGVMCLFIPFYFIYYALAHWEESSGPFALGITGLGFVAVPVVLAILLPAVARARGKAPSSTSASPVSLKANRALVQEAEWIFEQDIAAIDRLTNELARIRDVESAQQAGGAVMLAGRMLQVAAMRSSHVKLRDREWIVLKHSVGTRLRASIVALEQECVRVDQIAGFRGKFSKAAGELDKAIDFWTIKPGEETPPELEDGYIASVPRLPAEPSRPGPNPEPRNPDPVIPADADAITKSLLQLKSDDIGRKKEGINRLGRLQPNDRLEEVVAALLPLVDHDDGFLVHDVVETLGVWRSPQAVPKLIERTTDNRFFVRKLAIKVLGKYKAVRAAEPIADRLKEDGFEAEEALKEMGSIAEPALIARLKSPDSETRRRACDVLRDVGGSEALKAMRSIPPDADFGVRVAAQNAIKQITARVGPLPAASRSGGAPSGPPPRRRRSQ